MDFNKERICQLLDFKIVKHARQHVTTIKPNSEFFHAKMANSECIVIKIEDLVQ